MGKLFSAWDPSDEKDPSKPFGTIESDGNPIACVLQKGVGSKQAKANAHLISAAPELLEQLTRLRNKIAGYRPDDDDNLDIVDAVIEKATRGIIK